MKKYICIFAAFAAVLSCQKDAPVIPSSTETLSVPATLEIINPMTKLGIGTDRYVWTEGEQIYIRQHNGNSTDKANVTAPNNVLTYSTADGNSSNFSGNIQMPYKTSSWYAFYPVSAVYLNNTGSSSKIKITLPSKQTGTFEDYGDYKGLDKCLFMTSMYTDDEGQFACELIVDKNLSESSPENTRMYSSLVFEQTTMSVITPVVKLTIPEELGIKRITFMAYNNNGETSTPCKICGASNITFSTMQFNKEPGYANDTYNKITIYRSHEVISGDVYIAIYPDQPAAAISSANELYFKLEKGASSDAHYVEITKPITNKLTGAEVLNLGTVPTDMKFINPNASSQASVNFSGTVPSTTPTE